MEPTRLIIVRHGETEWNACGRLQNHLDSPLTELGVRQAHALAERLASIPIDAFYTSDLGRAVSTAAVIEEAINRSYMLMPALRERGMGCFEGLAWDEIKSSFPDHHEAFLADKTRAVPGGESGEEFQSRIAKACDELADRHPGQVILAVSHGHVLEVFLRTVMQIPLHQPRPARLPNASLNIFERHEGHWLLALWGDIGHLGQTTRS